MITLPERPERLRNQAVAVWSEPLVIPTYAPPPPDRNPLFLEKRVYQGSSGRVYPNAVTDRVSDVASETSWDAIHLENEYLRIVVLPQLGGRIHVVLDRKSGYDLFYRQNVIKPALVGLLGPWISGGLELNWPQHHRPSTFMPTDWAIEELTDGGAVVWCSEHEPMERMKGMHGVTLRPDSAVLELQVRLTNRTPLVQTFLWWANVGVRVHDDYEAFFPPDVTWVADHAKRAVSTFPVARGTYYGVDYGARAAADADLRWYRNIPVPTSYMVMGTRKDFFGGYDHAAREGYVHWADHTISPGKKLWTWGNQEFGYAWDRELTDADGPYVELMAGVFTDNQPDFSFLMPGEVRTFAQYWYPIQAIGPAHEANLQAAVSLHCEGGKARLGVATTKARRNVRVRLRSATGDVLDRIADVAPDRPFVESVTIPVGLAINDLEILVEHAGRELIRYRPTKIAAGDPPSPAHEPAEPAAIGSADELYLTGLHLQQYRHATRRPEDYYEEALRRDPLDSRCNIALGELFLRRGQLDDAAQHLHAALRRLTSRNPNPRDGEASYLLGQVLRLKGEFEAADDAFGKAAWSGPFQPAADIARAEIASLRGDTAQAMVLLNGALAANPADLVAQGQRMTLLRRAGQRSAAAEAIEQSLARDPLDVRARHERALLDGDGSPLPGDAQALLDIAHDQLRAGFFDEAIDILGRALAADPAPGAKPLLFYTMAWIESRRGQPAAAEIARQRAREADPDVVFPARVEEIDVLEQASAADPGDARAPYYLGNLLYDRRRYHEAITAWRRAARLDPTFATVHRNLGIAEFNVLQRPDKAVAAFRRAMRADPADARVMYELDQLRKRLGHPPSARLRALRKHSALVDQRDDLSVEYVTLLNRTGRHALAIEHLLSRRFHPWEGGEGLVTRQWVVAQMEMARQALSEEHPEVALGHAELATKPPHNLGEASHLLTAQNELQLLLAHCKSANGDDQGARQAYAAAASRQGDPSAGTTEATYWQALAMSESGQRHAARSLLRQMLEEARGRQEVDARIPYFATSLPTMLLFDDDLTVRSRQESRYLEGLALLGLGQRAAARDLFLALREEAPDLLECELRLRHMDTGEASRRTLALGVVTEPSSSAR